MVFQLICTYTGCKNMDAYDYMSVLNRWSNMVSIEDYFDFVLVKAL